MNTHEVRDGIINHWKWTLLSRKKPKPRSIVNIKPRFRWKIKIFIIIFSNNFINICFIIDCETSKGFRNWLGPRLMLVTNFGDSLWMLVIDNRLELILSFWNPVLKNRNIQTRNQLHLSHQHSLLHHHNIDVWIFHDQNHISKWTDRNSFRIHKAHTPFKSFQNKRCAYKSSLWAYFESVTEQHQLMLVDFVVNELALM